MTTVDVLKRSFVSGLFLLAPLLVTGWLLWFTYNWLQQIVDPIVEGTRLAAYTANIHIVAQLAAFVGILTVITVLGYVAQRESGQRIFGGFDRAVAFVPLVSVVYASVRQVANSLVRGTTRYERVVLVEHPRLGIHSIGLVTGESPREITTICGSPAYNVFLPNSPNPTAGRLVHVPEEQVTEIDMTVRRGLRLLVTTGLGEEDAESIPEV